MGLTGTTAQRQSRQNVGVTAAHLAPIWFRRVEAEPDSMTLESNQPQRSTAHRHLHFLHAGACNSHTAYYPEIAPNDPFLQRLVSFTLLVIFHTQLIQMRYVAQVRVSGRKREFAILQALAILSREKPRTLP